MTIGSGNRASKSTRQELSPSLVQDSPGIGATTAVFTVVHGVLIRPCRFTTQTHS